MILHDEGRSAESVMDGVDVLAGEKSKMAT